MVAADDSGGVRNLRLESDGNKVAGRLDGDVPRPGRMTILGAIDRPTSIRLRFVLDTRRRRRISKSSAGLLTLKMIED